MSDLIERLRHPAYIEYAGGLVIDKASRDDMSAAADEIERLRAVPELLSERFCSVVHPARVTHGFYMSGYKAALKDAQDEINRLNQQNGRKE